MRPLFKGVLMTLGMDVYACVCARPPARVRACVRACASECTHANVCARAARRVHLQCVKS